MLIHLPIHWLGTTRYGKVDEVPGVFHVATWFTHFYYVPIIPEGSRLVFSEHVDGGIEVRIGFSIKSFLVAWLRAALVISTLTAGVAVAFSLQDLFPRQKPGTSSLTPYLIKFLPLVLGGLTVASWRFRPLRYASYRRACALADRAGLAPHHRILIDRAFGLITEKEAHAALVTLALEFEAYQADE